MNISILTVLGLLGILLLVAVVWRLFSNRRSLPCPVWLRWMVELDNPFTKTNRAATIISGLDLLPGMSVADIGCGPGRLTLPLAQKGGKEGSVTALDIQPGMLQRTKAKATAAGLANIRYVEAGAGDGMLPENSYDRIVLVTVLGEIPNRRRALEEIFSALKPGGFLSVTEIIFDPHFQSCKTVRALAANCGFREKRFFGKRIAYTLHLEK